jgi:LPXTG-motif cell wall-anchored protein
MVKLPRTIRAVFTLAAAMLATMALGIGAAAAQEYPPGVAFSVDCVAAGEAGASVSCTVVGAQPGETLTVTATVEGDGTVVYSATLTADAQGEASFRFTVPTRYRGETIVVTVSGPQSGTVSDEVVVAAPGRTGRALPLPRTGTSQDTMLLTGLGVVLLAGGLTALRRRKVAKADARDHTRV